MNAKPVKLTSGLYFVATPIGTARDITLRALDILASADVLAAEDTRSLRRLMEIHGIALNGRPLLSYHDHNGAKARPKLMQYLAEGRSVAYASEAGTPLIADPGFDLSRAASEAGYRVTSAPGASALITALTLAGLPTDRFLFAGFLPNTKSARISALEAVKDVSASLIFYESPKRIAACLRDCLAVLGDREAALCRELTKKFEEVRRASLSELVASVETAPPKGEIVLIIDRGTKPELNESDLEDDLKDALGRMSLRDASEIVAGAHGLKKRQVYQLALRLEQENEQS